MFVNFLPVFSQDLTLQYGDLVVNHDTIYLTGTKSTELIEVRLSITNNRETPISLKLKKTEIHVVEGAETSFCWGECYTPAVFVSPMSITIQAGGCDRISFVGDYRPFEMEGTSIVKYTFFDPVDTTYQQSVTVFYQIGVSGIDNFLTSDQQIRVGPNPARESIRIFLQPDPQGARTVSLIGISGHVVLRQNYPAGQDEITLPVSGIPSGLYYVRISDEKGRQTTRKICIRH